MSVRARVVKRAINDERINRPLVFKKSMKNGN